MVNLFYTLMSIYGWWNWSRKENDVVTVKISKFGTFSTRNKNARIGRNPKSGEPVTLSEKHVPHFKPGKQLRERVNNQTNKLDIANN